MNMLTRTVSLNHFGVALIAGGALLAGSVPASFESSERAALRAQSSEVLSFVIADQGNVALQSIRAESRAAIRQWQLAPLPEPSSDAVVVADQI
jgi:hypothetical protein